MAEKRISGHLGRLDAEIAGEDTSLIGELTEHLMKRLLAVTKALSDETRVRAMLSLRGGELCLCQVVDFLGLSPSTVSKHMDLLYHAGLVERRKHGRWHYFRLVGRDGDPAAQRAVRRTSAAGSLKRNTRRRR